MLRDRPGKTIVIQNSERIHCLLPVPGSPSPVGGDVAQGQLYQLSGGIVIREVSPGLDDLAQAGIDAFDRVGRIDQRADWRREGKERQVLTAVQIGLTQKIQPVTGLLLVAP